LFNYCYTIDERLLNDC